MTCLATAAFRIVPSPLVGEGQGGGESQGRFWNTPTPSPSPQGGGEPHGSRGLLRDAR